MLQARSILPALKIYDYIESMGDVFALRPDAVRRDVGSPRPACRSR